MKSLELFLPYLLPQLPGCPEPLALQQLALAARDFCHDTHVIQVVTGPEAVVADEPTYTLTLPSQSELVQIERAWYGNRLLSLIPSIDIGSPLAYAGQVGTTTRESGSPLAAYTTNTTSISLDPPPDTSASLMLTVRFSVKPIVGATSVDDRLFDSWLDGVLNGALYRLCMLPAQPFSNPTLAVAALNLSRYYVSRARAEARVGRIQGDTRVQMRPFA